METNSTEPKLMTSEEVNESVLRAAEIMERVVMSRTLSILEFTALVERVVVTRVVVQFQDCRSRAAEHLGLKRTTLVERMKRYGLGRTPSQGQKAYAYLREQRAMARFAQTQSDQADQ